MQKLILVFILFILSACTGINNQSSTIHTSTPTNTNTFTNSKFCLYGCPKGASSNNLNIDHNIFLLSYNHNTKFSDWVAYKVVKNNLNGGSHKRNWARDSEISQEYTLIPQDYKGANKVCNYDRGHQAPLASFSNNNEWHKTNYLSNITPQIASLNQGPWVKLEKAVRNLAKKEPEVFVMTGPYYNKVEMCKMPGVRKGIEYKIPNGYWKIVAIRTSESIKVISFLMPQSASKKESFCKYAVSDVNQVKAMTRLKFFPEMPRNVTIEDLLTDIGCK